MQKLLFIILMLAVSIGLFAQSDEDKILALVKEGVIHHDSKEYEKAIQKYKEALEIDKKSTLANYELAMTYSEIGKYPEALKYADKVIKRKDEHLIAAYMIKGNVLDDLGKTSASIKLFKQAISETEGHYLLHYNLGINYFKKGELDQASQEMINAIKLNSNHASSHLYLALAEKRKGNVVRSLLPIYYYLLLEPSTQRARNAHRLLKSNLGGDVSRDVIDNNQINIVVDDSADNPYTRAELMISMFTASRFADDMKGLSDEQYFILTTAGIFELLGDMEHADEDIWSEFYIPFFNRLVKSDHLESFCQYILQGSSDAATQWVAFHPDELDELFDWLNGKKS